MSDADPTSPAQPRAGWRVLAGLVAAFAAIGIGHLVASLTNPAASPVVAVGSVLVDAAPTPVKTFAVRTLGTYDKPVLIGGVAVALLAIAAVLGLVAWRRRRLALTGIAVLGLAGMVAAIYRGGPADAIPSLLAGVAGVAALAWMTRQPRATPPPTTLQVNDRRRFLMAAGLTAAVAAAAGAGGVVLNRVRETGSAALRALGLPAPASPAPAIPAGAQVPGMTPFTTPTDQFYRVDISLVTPRIDVKGWSLTIDGMVDRPLTLTYDDLLAMPLIERDITLTCVSNEVGGPYVSSGRWLGVPFSELIARVGVRNGVDQAYSYSMDSGYTCSTPYAALSDGRDAMVAIGLNGQVLADARGFPARMIVPGLFGFVSATKWLERIEFTTYADRTAYWTDRGWATDAPILTQSRIDLPKSLATLDRAKPVIAGVAWAQQRGIEKVEIRIDGGRWQDTTLADDAGIDLWRQWTFPYDGPPGLHSAEVRATDLTGQTQPEQRTKVFPSGARGWHQIQFRVD